MERHFIINYIYTKYCFLLSGTVPSVTILFIVFHRIYKLSMVQLRLAFITRSEDVINELVFYCVSPILLSCFFALSTLALNLNNFAFKFILTQISLIANFEIFRINWVYISISTFHMVYFC